MKFEVSKSPYGEADEIGRLNEITPASRKRVLSRVDGGKVFEQLPSADPDSYLPVHCYLFSVVGVPIIEVLVLEELAVEKVYEFGFFGAPLRLRGSTGSPMRTFAMPFSR